MNFSSSKQLIFNVKNLIDIKPLNLFSKISANDVIYGWGRKNSGLKALELAKKYGAKFMLLEDGFIRSFGISDAPFGLTYDDIGIYYDSSAPSRLENILENYDFKGDSKLLDTAKRAIKLILENNISKYNNNLALNDEIIAKYELESKENVLVAPQTAGDASLVYGNSDKFTMNEILEIAIKENPSANILLKIHPDALTGKKRSNIDITRIPANVKIITENLNPIELLKKCKKFYTKTSGMGFEALICGCEVVLFGSPFYAGWGLSDDKIKAPKRRTRILNLEELFAGAYILYSKYFDIHTHKECGILDILEQIKLQKQEKNHNKLYLFGFSIWKRGYFRPFISEFSKYFYINTYSKNPLKSALDKGMDENSEIYIWGRKNYKEVERWASQNNVKITRVEDGFIRSVGLGCELTRPYSLVFDDLGIYFDTTKESRLERILNEHEFSASEIKQARILRQTLIQSKISKYNNSKDEKLEFRTDKTRILVIGQVDDDASIRFGTDNMSNLALLKRVKAENSSAFIIYKPHPDVLSGVRVGNIANNEALKCCEIIAKNSNLADLIEIADEVHTMTSLSGLEAIIRGKKVVSYGRAFWAGWGLSDDKCEILRRKRTLSIDELIAGVYILYPRYIHPSSLKPCRANELIMALKEQKEALKNPWILFKSRIRSFVMVLAQKIFKSVAK